MYKKNIYKSTYNSCKDGNDASQIGISPVILLFCNRLHMWKANLIIMHSSQMNFPLLMKWPN
jgi:hypothetical protein